MILKLTTELQKYIPVAGTFKIENVLPFVGDAQEVYMKRYLGSVLLQELDAFVESGIIPDWGSIPSILVTSYLNNLLPKVNNALGAFAFYLAVPMLDLKITDSGFTVTNNQTLAPASAERVKNFRAGVEATGFARIEPLLAYLEKNKASYPSWASSEACTLSTRNLVNDTQTFDGILGINESRITFQRLRPEIDNVEILQIEPVISLAFVDVLRHQIRTDQVSVNNAKVLIPLRKAVVYLTAGIAIDAKYTPTGTQYLGEVRKILDAHPELYPEYESSECYDSTKTSYSNYENKEENQTFIFGG